MKNIFLDEKWRKNHFIQIKKYAGPRYTPKLNIELPIAEIFDGIGRTDRFYSELQQHIKKFIKDFKRVSANYDTKEVQKIYNLLNKQVLYLSGILSKLDEFNTDSIPWLSINNYSKKAIELSWKLIDKLRNRKSRIKEGKKDSAYSAVTERFDHDIHYLSESQNQLAFFEETSMSTYAKLSNKPFLLLTGQAGKGKTHLLCDIVEHRLTSKLPFVLVFGEFFSDSKSLIEQIMIQLGEDELTEDQFLKLLDESGKQSKVRALLIIDALNEASHFDIWKHDLSSIINKIKKYPHIALIVSVRSGYEDEVFAEKQKDLFIHEEHPGFRFREWEAVTKFFKEFSLPLPEIPLLTPEFLTPLFLLLFCKAFEKRGRENSKNKHKRQSFRGHEGATYIFENFVKNSAEKIAMKFNLSKGRNKSGQYVIWDTIIETVASKMVEQNTDRISEDELIELIKKTYPSVDCKNFIKELDRGLLLIKIPRYSKGDYKVIGFDFKFPFQKFSDHLIGRYIFKKYEKVVGKKNKNLTTAKNFFSKRRKLGKLISKPRGRGLIEALSIQCPEQLKGIEFIDAAPYLENIYTAREAFIESLIWRKPTAFTTDLKNSLKLINRFRANDEDKLLNAFLSTAPVPEHPFNAKFLHKNLFKKSLADRDSWWLEFLHYQYGAESAIDRLNRWAWSEEDKSHISDNSILLTSIAISWFLVSSNRFLRDSSTKALISLLENRIPVLLQLLKEFEGVNDPYVYERLFAVAFGCTIRTDDKKNLKKLSEYIYKTIFDKEYVYPHILLRDYAREVIEYTVCLGIKLDSDINKIRPPYKSKWPSKFPTEESIAKYEFDYKSSDFKDYYWSQNSIINSMETGMGDFGKYVFSPAFHNWPEVSPKELSNLAIKRVFDLGYDVEKHGQFDRNINRHGHYGRDARKPERIGKKYQWIAFYEILAKVSDNYKMYEPFSQKSKQLPYYGPWEPYVRDVDPTMLIKNTPKERYEKYSNNWWFNISYDNWNFSNEEWLRKKDLLPNPSDILLVNDPSGNEWIILEVFPNWREFEDSETKPYKNLWYQLSSYLVDEGDFNKVINWAKHQNFMGRWMPESRDQYEMFSREYYWSPAYNFFKQPLYDRAELRTINDRERGEICKVRLTTEYFLWEEQYDCSKEDTISFRKPSEIIYKKMQMQFSKKEGELINQAGDLICWDPSVNNKSLSCLLIRKKDFLDFLKREKLKIFWTVLGEKQIVDTHMTGKSKNWLEISGIYYLENNKIAGSIASYLK